MSKLDELRELTKRKKELNLAQRQLKAELYATREERIAQRKASTVARKAAYAEKAKLRVLVASVTDTFRAGDEDKVRELAGSITQSAALLTMRIAQFADNMGDPSVDEDDELDD